MSAVPDIDPVTYVAMFNGRQPVPAAFEGVCGRVVRGRSEADLTMLAFASGRRLERFRFGLNRMAGVHAGLSS